MIILLKKNSHARSEMFFFLCFLVDLWILFTLDISDDNILGKCTLHCISICVSVSYDDLSYESENIASSQFVGLMPLHPRSTEEAFDFFL